MKAVIAIITLNAAAIYAATVPNPNNWFKARDANKDGRIDQQEFIRHQTETAQRQGKNWPVSSIKKRFSSLDLNSDGVILLSELITEKRYISAPSETAQSRSKPFNPSGYHDFMGKNGKSLRAKVLAYDSFRKRVTLQKESGRTHNVDPGLFSDEDQTYIRNWLLARGFHSESKFKVSAKRKQFETEREQHVNTYTGIQNSQTTVKEIGYEISLENRIAESLKNLTIEYCIYYEQERASDGKQVTDDGVKHGVLHIGQLAARAQANVLTDPVKLLRHELNSDWYYYSGSENTQKGKVIGIWLRVHLPLSDGQRITRQYSLPESIKDKKEWSDFNISVGTNRG
jgi:hypothetical protein